MYFIGSIYDDCSGNNIKTINISYNNNIFSTGND